MAVAGIDVGNLTTKTVIMEDGRIVGSSLITGADTAEEGARQAIEEALKEAGLTFGELANTVITGPGRKFVPFITKQKNPITCIAKGASLLFPSVRTVIDVGAETSTVVRVNQRGRVEDSAAHDRCASGTGVFLEAVAKIVNMPLAEVARVSLTAERRAEISTMCAVFAESEVISHVHRVPPTPISEIIAGVHGSMAVRLTGLAKRIGIKPDVVFCGGVAKNIGFVAELEKETGVKLLIPEEPQLVGALGAARIASEEK
jgi:predicted CoA-substrate-specific enzyme activase